MKENLQNFFKSKKTENLVFFLIVLIITMIIINLILKDDSTSKNINNATNTAVLAKEHSSNYQSTNNNLAFELEEILKKMQGVGNVSVLITYSENEVTKVPMYNENNTKNSTEEIDKTGNSKKTTSDIIQKEIVKGSDDNPVIKTVEAPKIEGAIITAQGASNIDVKSNIISAVEAATGLATYKIQVFEMKN